VGDILEVITSRRSIRRYTDDPIPDEMIDKILEAARWAPSGENCQPWKLIVVRDPETRKKIGHLAKVGSGHWTTAAYCLGEMQPRFAGIEDSEKRERVMKFMPQGNAGYTLRPLGMHRKYAAGGAFSWSGCLLGAWSGGVPNNSE